MKVTQFTWSSTSKPGLMMEFEQSYGRFTVSFGGGRVVSVETDSPRYGTPTGVGPQRSMARAAAIPGAVFSSCTEGYARRTVTTETNFRRADHDPNTIGSVMINRNGWVTC